MDNPNSPLDTLRQLKEMLDAGALTPAEFEALKQQLVFSRTGTAGPPAGAGPVPPAPASPAVSSLPPVAESSSLAAETVGATEPPADAATSSDEPDLAAIIPPAPFLYSPTMEPMPLAEPVPGWSETAELPESESLPARNPLALILSIGGVLVFLLVVLYLSFNRPPSEHISSTSQTAADSLAAPIETGPQVEQLPQPEAVPETVRVAPAHPAPRVQPQPAPAARDSAAAPSPAATSDSAASQ
ncbi:SHOCT domain-containing protein [Hymenobacter terricola]|uniref:SHOCT domain-containing protein n=1 Tax=Hymenobacter terricola TaxID=2819236 RepID=UPI001B30EB2D|nr:SHOCT domain-containing protein [Hymenobacter terricola]